VRSPELGGYGVARRQRVLVSALILAVVSSLCAIVRPWPARASGPKNPKDLPALASKAAHRPGPGAPTAADTRAGNHTGGRGYEQGKSKVQGSSVTEYSQIFDNPDGSHTLQSSPKPVRVRDGNGSWHAIDLTLQRQSDGSAKAKYARRGHKVSANSSGDVVSADTPAGPVGISHPDATGASATYSGSTATYKGGLSKGRDLKVRLHPDGFEEDVVLPDASAGNSYTETLSLPAGLSARQGPGAVGVELVDSSGGVEATFGGGVAFSANPHSGPGPEMVNVTTTLQSVSASTATIVNSVDPAWLDAPGRAFPVTIDPSWTEQTNTAGGMDTYAASDNCGGVYYASSSQMRVGSPNTTSEVNCGNGAPYTAGWSRNRMFLYFPLAGVTLRANNQVQSASIRLSVFQTCPSGCTPSGYVDDYAIGGSGLWDQTTLDWANMPALDSYAVNRGYTPESQAPVAPYAGGFVNIDLNTQPAVGTSGYQDSLATRWLTGEEPNYGVMLLSDNEQSAANFQNAYPSESGYEIPQLSITYFDPTDYPPAAAQAGSAPADGTVTTNLSPTLSVNPVTDPEGEQVRYDFEVSTGNVVGSYAGNVIADSGAITSSAWQVPAGVLQDGGSYTWSVWTSNPYTGWQSPAWQNRLKVKLRLGNEASNPYDDVGPVQVNLSTGNVYFTTTSHTVKTLSGDVGLSFSYNSQAPYVAGLSGSYYEDPNDTHDFSGAGVALDLARQDPAVNFNWGALPPSPLPATESYLVRWSGFLTANATGTYTFGAAYDGGAKVCFFYACDNSSATVALDRWDGQNNASTPVYGTTTVSLSAGQAVPIEVDYSFWNDNGVITLYEQPSGGSAAVVPASWLSPAGNPALPQGWTLNPISGNTPEYEYLSVQDGSAAAIDSSGNAHIFTQHPGADTGWTPPPGEDSRLSHDDTAQGGYYTLVGDDGYTYVFNADGTLARARSGADDLHPGAPTYTYSNQQLTEIDDPVSGQSVKLYYQGSPSCPAPPSGFDSAPPPGMLCDIHYWDGTDTEVFYNNGALARIMDPGSEEWDFAFNGTQLIKLRNPLAADAVAAGVATDDDTSRTVIAYDGSNRVSSVTLPKAQSTDTTQAAHSYTYVSATQTQVSIAGLSEPNGFARQVSFDSLGRTTADTDATNLTTAQTWDANNNLTSATDPAGRETTHVYDALGRLTDTYGPVPSSCFNGALTPGSCSVAVPHSSSVYDGNINGLAAVYYPDTTLTPPDNTSGTTLVHHTGVGDAAGGMDHDWGTGGSPDPNLSAGNWSGLYTGSVTTPASTFPSGTYASAICPGIQPTGASCFGMRIDAAGGVRLFIDGNEVINDWSDNAGTRSAGFWSTPGQLHLVRIETNEDNSSADAHLDLYWTPPATPNTESLVPGGDLSPDYGLVTSQSSAENAGGITARTTSTSYQAPETGLASSVTVDPGGANLTTSYSYENPATPGTYRRLTAETLPAGNATTYAYYAGNAGPVSNSCGASANQAGMLQTRNEPARSTSFVYDADGRPVGTEIGSEGWTCTTYDARGRVTSMSYPAYESSPARTVSYNYSVGGNPLVNSVSDPNGTVTTTLDLLGRVIKYSDAWANTTTTTYDQVGQLTDTSGPAGAQHWAYDAAGRATSQSLDGNVVANAAYTNGDLSSVSYPTGSGNGGNGTSGTMSYDPTGKLASLAWSSPSGSTITSDSVAYSQGEKITSETIDGSIQDSFGYDGPGRLTSASVPGHSLSYSYAGTGGCGTLANAGLNSDRTSSVDNGITTTYCYNNADQLATSTNTSYATAVYDSHGNATTLGTQSLGYDDADRHLSTTSGATTVTYTRDATDRIIARQVSGTTSEYERYGFSADGDSPDFTTDASNNVVERQISLIGGVILTKRSSGDVWSYSNIHGDVAAMADANGNKQGATFTYDPFGQALAGQPDNSAGSFDYGWLGRHERGTEQAAGINAIEMGARLYEPALGRFVQADPVPGGSANGYDYTSQDPVDGLDLDGTCGLFGNPFHICRGFGPTNPSPYNCKVIQDYAHVSTHAKQQQGLLRIGGTVVVRCSVPVEIAAIGKVSRSSWRGYQDFASNSGRSNGPTTQFTLNVYGACRPGSRYDYKTQVDVAVSGPMGDWVAYLQTPPVSQLLCA
jgi:RHS repeat-associated protein